MARAALGQITSTGIGLPVLAVFIKWLGRIGLVLAASIFAWSCTGFAMAQGGWSEPPRGVLINVDGRKQRLVCEGSARPGVPTVVFDAGAYSGSADWGYLQPEAAKNGRTCSYDRAGMGWSEPSSNPRDPVHLAQELHALLETAGEKGPYVLVGHSMAGLYTRTFITQYPKEVVGLVLIDAADPAAISIPETQVWIRRFQNAANLGASVSRFGLMRPLSPFFANKIGLSGIPLREKRRIFGSPSHMRASAAEINASLTGLDVALQADPLLAEMPVATITAGPTGKGRDAWKQAQARAARLSKSGSSYNEAAATHTTILGPVYGSVVLAAIERVRLEASSRANAN